MPLAQKQALDEWIEAARKAQKNAYAPYSQFRVGAALVSSSGLVHVGCNVENVSFGATICAERSAITSAITQGDRAFQAVVVVTDAERPVFPCGICRQVLAEFAPKLEVFAVNGAGEVSRTTLAALLPSAFESRDL